MNYYILIILLGTFFIAGILSCGCNSYAEPDIEINSSVKLVNLSPSDYTITYDISIDVINKGSNNAYDVRAMSIISTPKDLPEYRFAHENIEIGTIPKQETVSVNRRLSLQMTKANYDLLSQGLRDVDVETKITRVSSNIMG
ncbi:MAG: hypothetical protein GXY48_07450 [Methanomicrobiales archaeon]|nr:hypothetical protein [Methanomicrobiales archaeon]